MLDAQHYDPAISLGAFDSDTGALGLYLSVGFSISREVVHTITTPKGSREVLEYEIVMKV